MARAARTMKPKVVVIGAGVMGLATAVFLARVHGVQATVVERDARYTRASSALSASSIRVQFSQAVNVRLSRESFAMLRDLQPWLGPAAEGRSVGLVERGYLYLATAAGDAALSANLAVQLEQGACVQRLDPQALAQRFGALRTDDLASACLGLAEEGWFDAWSLLQALRASARASGVALIDGEATAVQAPGGRVRGVDLASGTRLDADIVLVAAGAWSATVLQPLGLALPVRPRKRDVFVFDAPAALSGGPLVIDPSGLWFRPEGEPSADGRTQRYLCGGPPRGEDVDEPPLEAIDHGLFESVLWPALAHRVPAFEALRQRHAWAGYYEMNTEDHNALIGPWPGVEGLFLCCGFSGHGIQQSPAVGRHLAHRMVHGDWLDPGLASLQPARLLSGERVIERNVI